MVQLSTISEVRGMLIVLSNKTKDVYKRQTYYAAKGSEFDNVFVPFANEANTCKRNAFYVACTRSSRNLYISYTGKRTSFLKDVSKENIVEIENN